MRYIFGQISFVALLAVGCSTTVPVTVKFPDAPVTLMEPAEPLKLLDEEPKPQLSDILDNTAENASRYYNLREKYNSWQKWYKEQRKIFEEAQKK
jgi:hypothetical protein